MATFDGYREDPTWYIQVERLAGASVRRITDAIADDIRHGVPYDTGELHDTIRTEYHATTGRVWVGTDHWAPTEYGSEAHPIEARPRADGRPGMLHFYWESEQRWVSTPRVRHPGTPEQPFIRPAVYRRRDLRGRAM